MNVRTAYVRLPWFAILSWKVIQISCRTYFFVVGMIYSHFHRHNSFCTVFWVSNFYLSVNIVLYQFTVTCIENWSVRSLGQWILESKVYLLIIHARTEKKGSRLRLCFWVVDEVPEKNEWICESRYMSSSKCLFTCMCGILFALKPFCDYSLCSVCILPQPAFYSQSVVCILPPGPQSAVRSPQSSFYTDRF